MFCSSSIAWSICASFCACVPPIRRDAITYSSDVDTVFMVVPQETCTRKATPCRAYLEQSRAADIQMDLGGH